MALSNAERQRRHYEGVKKKKRDNLRQPEITDFSLIAKMPFHEWFEGQAGGFSDFALCFDMAGMDAPQIEDDSDPKSMTGEIERIFEDDPESSPYARGGGSLARGEIMVGCLIDAASQLADIINRYKKHEISNRLREIESEDLTDPKAKKKALAETVRLQKMLDQLEKQVRWPFPQWKVSGE